MEQQLKRIQDKLQQLLKQYQLLQKENEKLTNENSSLKQKLQAGVGHTEELEQRMAALKMASGQLSEEDRKELEKRMNGYIREIDRCISILAE
jgi:FtsZ-binding cell division protein ZapB